MALPRPSNVLGKGFRVLVSDEVADLIENGQMLGQTEVPPLDKFIGPELERMQSGWPIFCWYGDQLMMVSYVNGEYKAFEVEERRNIPRPTLIDRVKQFLNPKPIPIDLNGVKRIDRFEYDGDNFHVVIEGGKLTFTDKETGQTYVRT